MRSREGMQRLDLGIRRRNPSLLVSSNVDGSPYLADTDFTAEGIHLILVLRSYFLRLSVSLLSESRITWDNMSWNQPLSWPRASFSRPPTYEVVYPDSLLQVTRRSMYGCAVLGRSIGHNESSTWHNYSNTVPLTIAKHPFDIS